MTKACHRNQPFSMAVAGNAMDDKDMEVHDADHADYSLLGSRKQCQCRGLIALDSYQSKRKSCRKASSQLSSSTVNENTHRILTLLLLILTVGLVSSLCYIIFKTQHLENRIINLEDNARHKATSSPLESSNTPAMSDFAQYKELISQEIYKV